MRWDTYVFCLESDLIQASTVVLSVQKMTELRGMRKLDWMISLKRTPRTAASSSRRGMLCRLMGAILERPIIKKTIMAVDCGIPRQAMVPSANCDASVNTWSSVRELVGRTCMQRGRETRSDFELSWSHFWIRFWNVMGKFSSQETPVRQTSCRMIFNVTTAGATKRNGSKTEAIKDKSCRRWNWFFQ